jgi:hypothetical protein
VDAEDHEQTMMALGLSSKREITRTRIRVRTAMGNYDLVMDDRHPPLLLPADAGSSPRPDSTTRRY